MLNNYKELLDDAYNKGYTNHEVAIVYIDRLQTCKINLLNNKNLLLGTHFQDASTNAIYRDYFHLMIVLNFQYELLSMVDNKELTNCNYYYSIKCGVLGFSNVNLYTDVDKYCNILKPKTWNHINNIKNKDNQNDNL